MTEKFIGKNGWLEDPEFISNMRFDEKDYLDELLPFVAGFLRRVPVHVVSSWDWKNKSMSLAIGKKHKSFRISHKLPVYEFSLMLDEWMKPLYPQYKVEKKVNRPLNESEIEKGIREGEFTLDESFNRTVDDIETEEGIITRIHLVHDEFQLVVNGKAEIRISGTINSPMSLRGKRGGPPQFLDIIETLKDDDEIHAFIYENSKLIKRLESQAIVQINYVGDMMRNWFVLNQTYLIENPLTQFDVAGVGGYDKNVYRAGKFLIKFDSEYHYMDCMSILKSDKPELIY